jgi:hypothetical protein
MEISLIDGPRRRRLYTYTALKLNSHCYCVFLSKIKVKSFLKKKSQTFLSFLETDLVGHGHLGDRGRGDQGGGVRHLPRDDFHLSQLREKNILLARLL